ncbi:MAG TPA: AAA family ATPase [Rhizomicrobium sp.]|jgi:predicted ATPase|nr:AAA family ATPase [Rhizomicrobium sp.]
MIRDNFHIFSGGPGVGKTTTLLALRARGYICVDEVARQVLNEQAAIGGDAHHTGNRARYRDLTLQRMLQDYHGIGETHGPVFFDRAIPELSGYGNPPGEGDPPRVTRAIAECRYNPSVFLFPPWKAIYCQDELRKQDFVEAVATYEAIKATYPKNGYAVVEVPRAAVAERVAFVLAFVGRGRSGHPSTGSG